MIIHKFKKYIEINSYDRNKHIIMLFQERLRLSKEKKEVENLRSSALCPNCRSPASGSKIIAQTNGMYLLIGWFMVFNTTFNLNISVLIE